jgi:hypothetical protein
VSQGPTLLPPRTKPLTSVAFLRQYRPTPIITAKNTTNMEIFTNIVVRLFSYFALVFNKCQSVHTIPTPKTALRFSNKAGEGNLPCGMDESVSTGISR